MRLTHIAALLSVSVVSIPMLVLAAMSDTEALNEARRRWGDRAATMLIRRASNTKLLRCVGVISGPEQVRNISCSEGSSWDAAFAAIAPQPEVPQGVAIHLLASRFGCIADLSKTKVNVNLFGGAEVSSGSYADCESRLYQAFAEIRRAQPQLVDAAFQARGIWLSP